MGSIFDFNESLFNGIYFILISGISILIFAGFLYLMALPFLGIISSLTYKLVLWRRKNSLPNEKKIGIETIDIIKKQQIKSIILLSLSGLFLLLTLVSPIITIQGNSNNCNNKIASEFDYLKDFGFCFDDKLESKSSICKNWSHINTKGDSALVLACFNFKSQNKLLYSIKSSTIYETFSDSIRKDSIQVYDKTTVSMHGIYPLVRIISEAMRTTPFASDIVSSRKYIRENQDELFIYLLFDASFTYEYIMDKAFWTGSIPLFSDDSDRMTYILQFIFFGGFVILLLSLAFLQITYISYFLRIVLFAKNSNALITREINFSWVNKPILIISTLVLISLLFTGDFLEIRYGFIFLFTSIFLAFKVQNK
jgi:hypothetical protein